MTFKITKTKNHFFAAYDIIKVRKLRGCLLLKVR